MERRPIDRYLFVDHDEYLLIHEKERNSMRMILSAVFLAALLMTTGCSHITLIRIRELQEVQANVDTLKTELSSMLVDIQKRQREQQEIVRLIRADQQVKFNELDRKVASLENNLSESQQQLSIIDQKTREIKERWDEKAYLDSLAQSMKDAERNKLFQLAFEDFHAMRYDLALRGFQDIIEQYPETETAEEASFWSAECFYAQKKTDEAEAAYKAYIRDFPDGVKSCVALYKLGVVYAEKEQQKAANLVWNKLLEQCPDSQEAITAKQRLADH